VKDKNPWANVSKKELKGMKKIAMTGMTGGKVKKLKLPK
jgi:phosphoheptose isomerase